jgi:hypothetical protein
VQIAIHAYGSVKTGAVADSSISAIDRVFDLVDSAVDKVDRVLNRTQYTEEQHRARRAKSSVVIDTAAAVKVARSPERSKVVKTETALSSTSTAIATQRFRIVEAVDAASGETIFVVTNGGNARAECSTRELAEKILRALGTSA